MKTEAGRDRNEVEPRAQARPGPTWVKPQLIDLVGSGAASAVALSLLLPWYTVKRPHSVGPSSVNGLQAFGHVDLLLAGLGVFGVLVGCFVPARVARVARGGCGLVALALVADKLLRLPAIPLSATAPHLAADYVGASGARIGAYFAAVVAAVLVLTSAVALVRSSSGAREVVWPSEVTIAAGVVGLAAILRFSTLGAQSYWYDELATVALLQPHLGDAFHAYRASESTPPLYYAIAWLWTRPFGSGEFALRFLSALFGTASVWLTYLAGRKLVSGRAGLLAAALVAVNPTLIWYSQEARAYSLLVACGALSLWAFAWVWREPSGRHFALWALACSLALLTHYYAIFVVAPEALVLLARFARRPRGPVVVAGGALVAVALALVPLAHAQGGGNRTSWIAGIPLGTRVSAISRELVSANTWVINENTGVPGGKLAYFAVAAVIVGVVWAAFELVRRRRLPGVGALVFALGAAAVLVPVALTQTRYDYLLDRNILAAWIALAVGLSAALALLPRRAGIAAVLVICAVGVVTDLEVAVRPALQRADWRHGTSLLGPATQTRAVIVIPAYARGMLGQYHQPAILLPALGLATREVDVFGTMAAATTPAPRLPGLEVTERKQMQQIGLIRLRSTRPVSITPASAAAGGIDPNAVMAQYSPGALAWINRYVLQLQAWRSGLGELLHAARAGRIDESAAQRLASSPTQGGLLPVPLDVANRGLQARLIAAVTAAAARLAHALLAASQPGTADRGSLRRSAAAFDAALSELYRADGAGPPSLTAAALASAGGASRRSAPARSCTSRCWSASRGRFR